MMGIGLEHDEPLFVQVINNPLDVLAIGTHVTSEPCNRLWAISSCDGAEDLPARACEPKQGNQPVACGQQQTVEPEEVQDEAGESIAGCGSLAFVFHRSP